MENLNRKKPYVVLNGYVDPSILSCNDDNSAIVSNFESDKKVKLFYAGTISKDMGIDCLVNAFLSLNRDDARLYICGNGDLVEDIKKMDSDKIVYLGVLQRETVLSLERKSDLLLNPRLIDAEFSKKSFPSKTFEYLISGVPVLSSHLKCFTNEYDDYMVYFEDNTFEEYSCKLLLCLENIEMLKEKAILAKKFVIESKSVNNYCEALLKFVGYKNED